MIKSMVVHVMEGVIGDWTVRLTNPGTYETDEWIATRWPVGTTFHSLTNETLTVIGWEQTVNKQHKTQYVTINELDSLLS